MRSQARYEVLDGLRGVAAIGVMFFHFSIIGLPLAHHGYLAVDFFFVLSGFVMSHAYAERLPTMGFPTFLKARLIRIMPLSLIGLAAGTLYFALRSYFLPQSFYDVRDVIFGAVFNAALIPKPWISSAPTDTIFTTNTPLWSLSLEMYLNILWALFLYKARSALIFGIVLAAGAAVCLISFQNGNADLGATWPTYLGGVSRAVFGFFAGVVVWRYRPTPNRRGFHAEFCAVALIAVIFAPDLGPLFDVAAIVLVFPAIIYIASCADFRRERPIYSFLGNLSYPLYVIHMPILQIMVGLTKAAKIEGHVYATAVIAAVACIVVATALDRMYDRPARKIITRLAAA